MSDAQPPLVYRFFRGIWRALNFSRMLVFNALFVLVVFVFLMALLSSKPVLGEHTALVIAPDATIVEQYSVDPGTMAVARAFGEHSKEVQLRDLLRALDAAKSDKRIDRVVIRPDMIAAGGMAQLREVARALREVRASGKEVIAYADNLDQMGYLLAAEANTVYLHPSGSLMLEGLGRYRAYYREGLQDKLGVDVHLFRVGEYKSAAEPYILDAASPESKEADLFWMNDIWQRYLADVGKARKLAPAQLAADIDALPQGIEAAQGDLGEYARQHKLVDGLKTQEQVEDLMAERGVADDDADGGFRNVDLDDYLRRIDETLSPVDERPRVAVVVAEGEISGGQQPPGRIGGESTAELLRAARDDDHVKAVVLRVDSPGGEVFASEQIRREVVGLKQAGKPVVVSMGDLAASGGYWIGMDADRIYADPSTITGSIGIFGLFVTVPDTLAKLGIHTDGVGTTPLAGTLDIRRPLSPQLESILDSVIHRGYSEFIGKVARARGKTPEQVDRIAQGRVWSGAQAKERGLVDKLGGLDDAIAAAAARAKLGKGYEVRYVERAMSTWERVALSLGDSETIVRIARSAGFALPSGVFGSPELKQIAGLVESLRGRRYGAFAHCFCELH